MRHGMNFATVRLIVVTLAVASQVYLFLRFSRAVSSWRRSRWLKAGVILSAGAAIAVLFAGNRYIMFHPIPWVDPPLAAQLLFFYLPAVWGVASILSALVLFLAQCLSLLGRVVVLLSRRGRREDFTAVNMGRRRFLKAGVGGLVAAPFIFTGYGAVYAGRTFEPRELTLRFGRALRVVQLTDIHAGIFMRREELRRLADQVIALRPDLFVLTGDYISNSMTFFQECIEEMARVRARYGTFATLGNHEHWYGDLNRIRTAFIQHRIPLLTNAHSLVRAEQGPFAVVGIDDLRAGRPNLDAALYGLAPDMPAILLSHRPEIFPQAARRGIHLTLAGHYHGGQIKIESPLGDFSVASLMTPYPEGLYRIGDSHLYVSRGIGTTFTPVRMNVPPEITVLNLTA